MSYPSEPELGWYYVVNVAGEVGGVQYEVGDWIVWNGTTWDKLIGKSDVLPIGAVIMYDGTGIVNIATREVELGDEPGDGFAMPGWYVCNGLAGTPDLEKMFVRGGLVSGVVEGSDDAVVVEHTHGAMQESHAHDIHSKLDGTMYDDSAVVLEASTNQWWKPDLTKSSTPSIEVVSAGVSGVGKNVPIHYVVIYIKKMS